MLAQRERPPANQVKIKKKEENERSLARFILQGNIVFQLLGRSVDERAEPRKEGREQGGSQP